MQIRRPIMVTVPNSQLKAPFDTSDYNVLPHGTDRDAWLPPDHHDPLVTLIVGDQVAIFEDRGHVLDWGGMDIYSVQHVSTEAAQWTQAYRSVAPPNLSSLSLSIGQTRKFSWTGPPAPNGHYELIPFTPPRDATVGFLTAVTVTATDANGNPINGVVFAVFANDKHVGSAKTFNNGTATVNFVPASAGTYSMTAAADAVMSARVTLTVVPQHPCQQIVDELADLTDEQADLESQLSSTSPRLNPEERQGVQRQLHALRPKCGDEGGRTSTVSSSA
jgi:hypothetical protein